MSTTTTQPTGADAIAHMESQGRLEPGTWGYWPVWGAVPYDIQPGDILITPDAVEYVEETYTAKAAPARVGYVADGKRWTIGALAPVAIRRWDTQGRLGAHVR